MIAKNSSTRFAKSDLASGPETPIDEASLFPQRCFLRLGFQGNYHNIRAFSPFRRRFNEISLQPKLMVVGAV